MSGNAFALLGCCAEDPATWNDLALVWARYKFHPENTEFADALPVRETTIDDAAFGRHEMVVYFDACREIIADGWRWLLERRERLEADQLNEEFATVMHDLLKSWLASPFKGGPTAESIIRSDRLRLPLYSTGADQSDIDLLNNAFRTYRTAESLQAVQSAADAFKQALNELADRHQFLVSRE